MKQVNHQFGYFLFSVLLCVYFYARLYFLEVFSNEGTVKLGKNNLAFQLSTVDIAHEMNHTVYCGKNVQYNMT